MNRWGLLLFLILFLPLMGLLRLVLGQQPSLSLTNLFVPFVHTTLLSLASGVLVVGASFFASLALASRPSQHIFNLLSLLPSMIPQLFLLLAVLSVWSPFPFGWVGTLLGIMAATSGIVTVGLANSIRSQFAGLAEAAQVLGAKRSVFVLRVLIPGMRADLAQSFYLVFGFVFSTFAIPLVLGAGQIRTLEFEAYRKAFQDFDYWIVLALAALQFTIIFVLGTRTSNLRFELDRSSKGILFLHSRLFDFFLFLVPTAVTAGLGRSFLDISSSNLHQTDSLLIPTFGTLLLAIGVGVFVVFLFWLFTMAIPSERQMRIVLGLQSPSTVLIALGIWGLLAIPISRQTLGIEFALMTLAIGISSFCVVIKMGWVGRWAQLRGQIEAARILGAPERLIREKILWAQMRGLAWSLGGWTALWAAGDFTFSSLLASNDWTLGLLAESFLGFYRLQEAFLVTLVALVIGGLVLAVFQRRGRVLDSWD